MSAPLLLIPLAIEWVILVTTLAPTAFIGRFTTKPRLGILVWFASFLTAGASVLIAVAVALWAYTDTVSALIRNDFGSTNWLIALMVSFAPWIALALGGVSLALVNLKLEPISKAAKELKPLLELSKTPLFQFMGTPVSTVDLPFAYALATKREIVISRSVVERLSNDQLDAVLWHELCHVRENHFAIKRLARFILALSPFLAASQALVSEIERLVEIAADNFALRRVSKPSLELARKIFTS